MPVFSFPGSRMGILLVNALGSAAKIIYQPVGG
jgi:hypothetical protein